MINRLSLTIHPLKGLMRKTKNDFSGIIEKREMNQVRDVEKKIFLFKISHQMICVEGVTG